MRRRRGVGQSSAERSEAWWSGEIERLDDGDELMRPLYEDAATLARPVPDEPRLLVLDRHRTRIG